MTKKREISYFVLFGLVVLASMILFLTVINPLVVYDTDDWLYIAELRKPIPMMHVWNPTKVFPETAMPAISYIGAWLINPIINNYCRSLTLAHGIFGAVVLTIYFVQFAVLFYRRNLASAKESIAYGCLFILLHFISHILRGHDNAFMLGTINITCFYNYTLAAIINAILVMHFMSYGGLKAWFAESKIAHKIVVFIWMYFAINSNLYSSVILAAYIGTELLLNLINDVKVKAFNIKSYCANNWLSLLIIVCWLGSNVLETTGGRSDDMHKSILLNLPITVVYALSSLVIKNAFVTILDVVVFVLWYRLQGKKLNDTAKRFVIYIGLVLLYLTLLSASVEPYYITKAEVEICTYFYIFMGMIACLNELIKANKKYARLPLILLGTIVFLLINPGRVLIPYNFSYLSYSQCEAVMNDMIAQFKEAEEAGEMEIVLEIPKFDSEDNWPFCDFIGERVAKALYRHHITDTYITVKDVKFSQEKTKEFGINPAR